MLLHLLRLIAWQIAFSAAMVSQAFPICARALRGSMNESMFNTIHRHIT